MLTAAQRQPLAATECYILYLAVQVNLPGLAAGVSKAAALLCYVLLAGVRPSDGHQTH
jgi:hypothetical protein